LDHWARHPDVPVAGHADLQFVVEIHAGFVKIVTGPELAGGERRPLPHLSSELEEVAGFEALHGHLLLAEVPVIRGHSRDLGGKALDIFERSRHPRAVGLRHLDGLNLEARIRGSIGESQYAELLHAGWRLDAHPRELRRPGGPVVLENHLREGLLNDERLP
jgi:hypothetical protein